MVFSYSNGLDFASRSHINFFLKEICGKLQIPESQRIKAKQHYEAIANLLNNADESSLLSKVKVKVFPYGSLGIDTTIKPLSGEEYDLDLAVVLMMDYRLIADPIIIQRATFDQLYKNGIYRERIEQKDRCVRLNYAGDFHIDLMSACPAQPHNESITALKIPQRSVAGFRWVDTDLQGFMKWFTDKSNLLGRVQFNDFRKSIEMVPLRDSQEIKPTLHYIVQLLKRSRDIFFDGDEEGKKSTKSIVLTTLAGLIYEGEADICSAFGKTIDKIVELTENLQQLHLCNPINHHEDFSESWKQNPARYKKFRLWAVAIQTEWKKILSGNYKLPELAKLLGALFGTSVTGDIFSDYARMIATAQKSNLVGVTKDGVLTSGPALVTSISRHAFYGD